MPANSRSSARPNLKPAWGKIVAFAVLVATLAAVWRYTPLAEIATAENIVAWTRTIRERSWAPFVLIGAYVAGACVMFPRPLLTLVSVLTFGIWRGLVYGIAGVLIAALVTYSAGRLLPRHTVRRIAGDNLDKAAKPIKKHGVAAVFASNMSPVPPFVVQNIIAGTLRIPLWQFLLGTFLAMLPGVLAWTVFGDQINAALEDPSTVSYWMIGGALILLAGFTYLARRWLRKRTT
jgi:phospholipase D1/2